MIWNYLSVVVAEEEIQILFLKGDWKDFVGGMRDLGIFELEAHHYWENSHPSKGRHGYICPLHFDAIVITVAVDAVVDDENVTIKSCHFDRGGFGVVIIKTDGVFFGLRVPTSPSLSIWFQLHSSPRHDEDDYFSLN